MLRAVDKILPKVGRMQLFFLLKFCTEVKEVKIILKHILRNMKEHKGRSLLIFFALLVSTSVFVISMTVPDDLTVKIEDTLRGIYGNAEVSISTVDPFRVDDLKLNNHDFKYGGYISIDGVDQNDKPIILYGLDVNTTKSFKMIGDDVKDLGTNEIAVSKKTADKKNYKVGDVISLTKDNLTYNLVIKQIIDNKGLASISGDDPMFFANLDTAYNISKTPIGYYDTIFLDMNNDDKIDSFIEYFEDHNDNYNISKTVDVEEIKEETQMIGTLMLMITLMATIMIYFVIGSLNKIVLAERIPIIGTFRSVGASRSKMNFILILENALYGLFAGFLGSILGVYLDSIVSNLFVSADGIDVSQKSLSISPGILILGIMFATLLQVFIVAKEIIRTNKKPIKTLIFNTQNSRYRLRKRRTVIGFILLITSITLFLTVNRMNIGLMGICMICYMIGVSNTLPVVFILISKLGSKICKKLDMTTGIMCSKNIGYNKMIIASSRLVVIAISLLSSIVLMSNSITKEFSNFREVTKGIDIMVEYISKTNENYEHLRNVKGIKDVKYLNSIFPQDVTYNNGKKFNIPAGFYAEEKRNDNFIEEIDYKISDLKENEILMDEKYAYNNKISKGDTITITYGEYNKTFTYKVVGYVDSSNHSTSRNMFVVNFNHMKKDLSLVPLQIQLVAEDDVDLTKLKDIVKDNIKEVGIKVYTTDEYITEQENQIAGITGIVYLIIGISVLLAFVGIINNQIISFISRKKELAILNSTCMNKTQIKKLLALETIVANIIALTLALIVTILTTSFINGFLENIGLFIDVKFDIWVVLRFSMIIYIILLFTLVFPFRRLKKMNIVDEIKYE